MMKIRQLLALAFAMFFTLGLNMVFSQKVTTAEQMADPESVRKLIVVSGGASTAVEVTEQLLVRYRTAHPKAPDSFWKQAEENISAFDFLEMMVPSYQRYLTDDEIKQLIEFYESPVGRKLVQVQPLISLESMQAGQQWGESAVMVLEQKLKEGGYK